MYCPQDKRNSTHLIHIYILKTPKRVFCVGALRAELRLKPRTRRVSAGSIIPSSHNLGRKQKVRHDKESSTKIFLRQEEQTD